MGKRGPAPLPAELHAKRGTLRPDRHGDGTPFALAGKPVECPPAPLGFTDEERATWGELVPIFHAAGVLDHGDVFALEAMIVSVARARLADELLRAHDDEHGRGASLLVRGDRGSVTNPLVKISRDAWAEARSWFAKFGATPSDRVGLAVGGLAGMNLAEQLRRALEGDDDPAPAQLELLDHAELCDATRKRDGAPCTKDAEHDGRHRYS